MCYIACMNKPTTQSLKKWNIGLAVLHAGQALAVLLLAKNILSPVTTSFLTTDTLAEKVSGQTVLAPAQHTLFNINLAHLVVAFFLMSALAHLLVATRYRKTYETNLKLGINKARWMEYSFSASTMMVAIAMLCGVYDLSLLLTIFGLTAVMNLMGLLMELNNKREKKVNWTPFWIGCLAGILPWLVVFIYTLSASVYGSSGVPTFVYFIELSLFIFFNCFAINMYLQYKRKGKWADYLYGERAYMILSLVAKSALAWQVFFGTLR